MAAECCAFIGDGRCQYSVNFACSRTVSVQTTNDLGEGGGGGGESLCSQLCLVENHLAQYSEI